MAASDAGNTGFADNLTHRSALSDTDLAILHQLSLDPLASNRVIAEALGLSTSQVAARTRRFDKQRITRVVAVLDLTTAGQNFCFVKVRTQGRPPTDVAIEISKFRKTLSVYELLSGTDDLLILVRYTNREDLTDTIFNALANIDGVHCIVPSAVIDIPIYRREYPSFVPRFLPMEVEKNIEDISQNFPDDVIDSIDRCIIAELQRDGRKSLNGIARRYNINPGTIRYRVKNLEARELIRFITLHDPLALGIHAVALVEIEVSANHIKPAIEKLRKHELMHQIFLCAGPAPIKFFAQAGSHEAILRLKNEALSTLEGVVSVTLTPLGHVHKEDFRWGQRFTE